MFPRLFGGLGGFGGFRSRLPFGTPQGFGNPFGFQSSPRLVEGGPSFFMPPSFGMQFPSAMGPMGFGSPFGGFGGFGGLGGFQPGLSPLLSQFGQFARPMPRPQPQFDFQSLLSPFTSQIEDLQRQLAELQGLPGEGSDIPLPPPPPPDPVVAPPPTPPAAPLPTPGDTGMDSPFFRLPQGDSYSDLDAGDKETIAREYGGIYYDSQGNRFEMTPEQLGTYQTPAPAQLSGVGQPAPPPPPIFGGGFPGGAQSGMPVEMPIDTPMPVLQEPMPPVMGGNDYLPKPPIEPIIDPVRGVRPMPMPPRAVPPAPILNDPFRGPVEVAPIPGMQPGNLNPVLPGLPPARTMPVPPAPIMPLKPIKTPSPVDQLIQVGNPRPKEFSIPLPVQDLGPIGSMSGMPGMGRGLFGR